MQPDLSSKRTRLRYRKILEVGFKLFLKNGYKNTSLSEIVEQSGGSLSTIYKYFYNKQGLFKAIVLVGVDKFASELKKRIVISKKLSLEEFLLEFSKIYLKLFLSETSISFHKLVLSEGFNEGSENIGKLFFENTSMVINKHLIEFFKKDEKMSKFSDEELENFSLFYLYLIREPYFINELIFNKPSKLEESDMESHCKTVIKRFLYGILS